MNSMYNTHSNVNERTTKKKKHATWMVRKKGEHFVSLKSQFCSQRLWSMCQSFVAHILFFLAVGFLFFWLVVIVKWFHFFKGGNLANSVMLLHTHTVSHMILENLVFFLSKTEFVSLLSFRHLHRNFNVVRKIFYRNWNGIRVKNE